MNKEMELVLRACKLELSEQDAQYICDMVDNGIDYSKFLYYCVHNRVVALVWNNFVKLDLQKKIEGNVRRAFIGIREYIKNKNVVIYDELNRVNMVFEERGLKAILLKGAILAPTVYGDISLREFGDVDYLIQYEDIEKAEKTLTDLGYIQGKYSAKENRIIPASRAEIIQKKKYSHELVEFFKIDDNHPEIVHMIDVNYAIFWKGKNERFSFDNKSIFEHAKKIEIMHSSVYNMETELQLIQLCAHLYSEAVYFLWDSDWKRNKAEISLFRFCDIYEFIRSEQIDWDRFNELVKINNIAEPIEYCFSCITMLFGNCIPDTRWNKNTQDIVNKYYDLNDNEKYWNNDIYERLFDIQSKKSI